MPEAFCNTKAKLAINRRNNTMITLSTERLILRDWCKDDIGCSVHNEDAIRYLIKVKNNYAIVLKENNEIIGTIGLNEDADGNVNIRNVGVRIVPQHQNKGYMSEALKAVLDSTADTLSWCCKAEDLRSQHIAEKLGFAYVKTFAKAQYNLPSDFYYYILEKSSNSF